ncbi:unnamed protein product [Polarella glacialis]|uniref:RING-type domain-containing protein n=1 Tax=Polarella glacialis TaxID=89957 RepID=A0A813EJ17_POLGL|nr:unnamed protein product [Polarella glacialis]
MEYAWAILIMFGSVVAICFAIILLSAWSEAIVDLRLDRTGEINASQATDKSTLDELAELAFPEVCVLDELMCSICLDVIAPTHPARKLSCGHAYHASCISCWWNCNQQSSRGKVTCPSFRKDLFLQN